MLGWQLQVPRNLLWASSLLGQLLDVVTVHATIRYFHASDADTFKTENFGGIAEKSTTEIDNGLSDRAEISDFGLLESCHQLSKSIVEVFFLIPDQIVRGAEV